MLKYVFIFFPYIYLTTYIFLNLSGKLIFLFSAGVDFRKGGIKNQIINSR